MENIFILKVKQTPNKKNLYPSERRYSAAYVFGLAWIHLALAAASLLLIILITANSNCLKQSNHNKTNDNYTSIYKDNNFFDYLTLLSSSSLMTIFGFATGIAAMFASVKWYIDSNIKWLLITSAFTTFTSIIAFCIITIPYYLSEEKEHYFIINNQGIVNKNSTHMIVKSDSVLKNNKYDFVCNMIMSNIIIAAIFQFLLSVITLKISYKGVKTKYEDDITPKSVVTLVTKIKGKRSKMSLKDKQLKSLSPETLKRYTNNKIRQILADIENDSKDCVKNEAKNDSDLYKERIMTFLNSTLSEEQTENVPTSFNESHVISEINDLNDNDIQIKGNLTLQSWGDNDHSVYNQNTINLDKIFNLKKAENNDIKKV